MEVLPQEDEGGPGLVEGEHGPARDVVVVAASAGGLEAFGGFVEAIDPAIPAGIALVYHRNPQIDGNLLAILQRRSRLPVVEPAAGDPFRHGCVFVAPRDRHLLLDARGTFVLSQGPPVHYSRPAADTLFTSAAKAFGPRVLGVVLSGAGLDGARGCQAIKQAGGVVLVQDLREASFPFMPMNTIDRDHPDAVLTLPELAAAVQALAAGGVVPGVSSSPPSG
jgi:two-component system chemotaxis response regulator CheB